MRAGLSITAGGTRSGGFSSTAWARPSGPAPSRTPPSSFTALAKPGWTATSYHYTYADIRQHIRKNVCAAYDGAVAMHNRGRRATPADFLLRAPWSCFRSYILQRGFLDGFYGFVIAASAGFYTFLKYAMLHEMNHRHRHQPLPDAIPESKPRR